MKNILTSVLMTSILNGLAIGQDIACVINFDPSDTIVQPVTCTLSIKDNDTLIQPFGLINLVIETTLADTAQGTWGMGYPTIQYQRGMSEW